MTRARFRVPCLALVLVLVLASRGARDVASHAVASRAVASRAAPRATATMFKAALTTIKSAIPDEVAQAAKKRVNQWKGIGDDEALVRDATNSEPWGPHGEQLRAIARLTRDGKWDVVREVLEKRLKSAPEEWRRAYKALTVVEYLVANGDRAIAEDVRRRRMMDGALRFEYKDARGKDEGVNVRHRAEKIKALVEDPRSVEEAREKAERNRGKYAGMSSEEARTHARRGSTSSAGGSFSGGSALGGDSERRSTASISSGGGAGGAPWNRADEDVKPRAPVAPPSAPAPAFASGRQKADSSDDEDDAPLANAAPKIVFRDVPVPSVAPAPGVMAFAPPPRAANAVMAVNYSSASSAAPAPTSSIDDLLGGLSAPAVTPAAAPAAAPVASGWGDLDNLFNAPNQAHAPPQPAMGADPLASFGAPAPRAAPSPANQFGFAPPPQASAMHPHAAQVPQSPPKPAADPFGLSSFGSPGASPRLSGGSSPRKPPLATDSLDALAALTKDLGFGSSSSNDARSQNPPMSPAKFTGGSLI